jgi:type II secretory pathway component PulF
MNFTYAAFNKAGKAVSGTLDAASEHEARESLRRQGYFVSTIGTGSGAVEAKTPKGKRLAIGRMQRLNQLARFSRQLQVLISSGTPLVQALGAIERQTDHAGWSRIVAELREKVEEGAPMSDAMRCQPGCFDAIALSLIAAGESSGNMSVMLDRLAVLSRKQLHLYRALIGALVYPTLLIGLGIAVLCTMMLFVLPRFTDLFASLDTALPPTTKAMMWLSEMFRKYWWGVGLALAAAGVGFSIFVRGEAGRKAIHTWSIRTPKVGTLVKNLMTARLSRMLGTLLESRVPLLDALKLTKESAVNFHYVALLARAEDAVSRGEPISAVLCDTNLIAPCVQESVRNGEQSGQIGAPLMQMADFLDEENDVVMKSLTTIIEPLILITLGVVVGFIAISMFLPLFDLVSATQSGAH